MRKYILNKTVYSQSKMHSIGLMILQEEKKLSLKVIKKYLYSKQYIFMFSDIKDREFFEELKLINKKYYEMILKDMIKKISKSIKLKFWRRMYQEVINKDIDYMTSRKIVDLTFRKNIYFISINNEQWNEQKFRTN